MIAAAVLAAVLAPADVQRSALLKRWTQASKSSVPVSRRLPDAALAPPGPSVSPQAIAARELSVPGRYRLRDEPPPPPRKPPWWQPVWQWFVDRLKELWDASFGRVHVGTTTTTAIAYAVLFAIVAGTLYAASRLAIGLTYGRRRAAGVRALLTPPDAAALYASACDAAARGEYALAARLLFAATLAMLDVRGAAHDDPTATVGDVRRELRRTDASVVPSFDAIASAFVAGTYAERPIGELEWARARDAYTGLAEEPT